MVRTLFSKPNTRGLTKSVRRTHFPTPPRCSLTQIHGPLPTSITWPRFLRFWFWRQAPSLPAITTISSMSEPSGSSSTESTFNTLAREKTFRNPPTKGSTYEILNEFVTPHIESFNALFDDSGLPVGDGDGSGLLSLALKDIGERVVFDGQGSDGSWGNKMRSKSLPQLPRNRC